MEELFQLLLELFLQFIGEILVDTFVRSTIPLSRTTAGTIWAAILAALLGYISTQVFPHHLIVGHTWRVVALVVLPFVNGALMQAVGFRFAARGRVRSAFEYFAPAFTFSLIFGLVRYLLAT